MQLYKIKTTYVGCVYTWVLWITWSHSELAVLEISNKLGIIHALILYLSDRMVTKTVLHKTIRTQHVHIQSISTMTAIVSIVLYDSS